MIWLASETGAGVACEFGVSSGPAGLARAHMKLACRSQPILVLRWSDAQEARE
jgi:hypothetical protein